MPAAAAAAASLAVPVDKVLSRDLFKVAAAAPPQVKRVDLKPVGVAGLLVW
jgi:hypothetical protein